MARYIVEKKGLFGTLYIDTPMYNVYPSTTRDIKRAYQFEDYEKAVKIARKIFADVIEVEQDEPIRIERDEPKTESEENFGENVEPIPEQIKVLTKKESERKIILCKNCIHFKHPLCELDNEPKAIDDFCSKAKEK